MTPCPTCDQLPAVRREEFGGCYVVECQDCYDADCVGDPPRYVCITPSGRGVTRDAAIAAWDDVVREEYGCSGCGEVIAVDAPAFTVDGDERYHEACKHMAHWSVREESA